MRTRLNSIRNHGLFVLTLTAAGLCGCQISGPALIHDDRFSFEGLVTVTAAELADEEIQEGVGEDTNLDLDADADLTIMPADPSSLEAEGDAEPLVIEPAPTVEPAAVGESPATVESAAGEVRRATTFEPGMRGRDGVTLDRRMERTAEAKMVVHPTDGRVSHFPSYFHAPGTRAEPSALKWTRVEDQLRIALAGADDPFPGWRKPVHAARDFGQFGLDTVLLPVRMVIQPPLMRVSSPSP